MRVLSNRKSKLTLALATLFLFLLSNSNYSHAQLEKLELDQNNYETWREHILPSEKELKFFEIPWRRSFMEGIEKANSADKPVLLWVMNGHPLGCT